MFSIVILLLQCDISASTEYEAIIVDVAFDTSTGTAKPEAQTADFSGVAVRGTARPVHYHGLVDKVNNNTKYLTYLVVNRRPPPPGSRNPHSVA